MSPQGPDNRAPLRKAGDADVHPTAPTIEDARFGRPGMSTGDSVGAPDKDKLVDLGVQIPKSLRKSVRAEAERRGITVDQLVAEALRERTAR
ncbi:MAG: hypothetical protein PSX37_07595 [bacterium]|nr:hypothetical protein [bacterium]